MRFATLEVDLPDDWEDRSLYSFIAPVQDVGPALAVQKSSFRSNAVFQRRPLDEGETLESCAERLAEMTGKTLPGVDIEISDGPAGHFASKRLVYTLVDDVTQQPVAQALYVCIDGDIEWQVAFSVAAILLDGMLPELDRIVASMRPA